MKNIGKLNPHVLRLAEEAGCLDVGLDGIENAWEFGEQEMQRFVNLIIQHCIIALWNVDCQENEAIREAYLRSAKKIYDYWGKENA